MFKNRNQNISNESRQSKQNNKKSLLRNLIADKTFRHHQDIQKLVHPPQILSSNFLSSKNSNSQLQGIPAIKQFQINSLQGFQSNKETGKKSNIQLANDYVLKQEIELLKKYSQYIKSQNESLKTRINTITTKECIINAPNLNQKCQIGMQTCTEVKEIGIMTALNLSDISQLQQTLEISSEHTTNLMKQLQCSYANIDQLSAQIEDLNKKIQLFANESNKKNEELEIVELELSELRKGILINDNPLWQSQTMTTLNLQTLENILTQNEDLKIKNQIFIEQKLKLQKLYNQISQNGEEFQVSINNDYMEKIKEVIREKIGKNTKPLEEQIKLQKELFETQKRKYKDKQNTLNHLLLDAHKTIQQLMNQLRTSKKQAKDQFINNLIKQRTIIGVRTLYQIPQQ